MRTLVSKHKLLEQNYVQQQQHKVLFENAIAQHAVILLASYI